MLEGKILSERYKIKKMIGGGGMANVYLGTDLILKRDVAIKVLRLEYANDEEFISRFHREAQSATTLSHPNVVSIYDVGEENQIYYMVMEYIDGMTLKQYIQLHAPMEVEETIDIMKQLASAIRHAHEFGIIHRDIKPQNMLIDQYGTVKVTDFGIATALSATALTQTNSVLGSIHYLSPEQARGGKANQKSDIYSLGIVMFEMLTGTLPFSGQSPVSIALKHLQREIPSVREWNPNIPQSVENIILIATTKDPLHRYQHMMDMEHALDQALDPSQLFSEKYVIPPNDDELTKAIPIITNADQAQEEIIDDEQTVKHVINNNKSGKEKNLTKETKKSKKPKKKKKVMITIISVVVILLGASLVALFLLPGLFQPKDVTIPNELVGKPIDEVEDELISLGLEVTKEKETSEEVQADHVTRTNPSEGQVVKEGREITVYVSEGPKKVTMKDYVGKDFDRTKELLEESGFQVIKYDVFSEDPIGMIVSQHQPNPDEEVVPNETTVIFEVSMGEKTFSLNRLIGLSIEEATEYINDNNLSLTIDEVYHDEIEAGHVIEQKPSANAEVVDGEMITLTVSKGPDEPAQVTHTESFTVPYTYKPTDEEEQEKPQSVSIYVEDVNNRMQELYEEVTLITEDTTFEIELTIAKDDVASYKVIRDDQVLIEKTIKYEDVKGE